MDFFHGNTYFKNFIKFINFIKLNVMWKRDAKYQGSITSTAESWVWPNLNALIDLTITPQKL